MRLWLLKRFLYAKTLSSRQSIKPFNSYLLALFCTYICFLCSRATSAAHLQQRGNNKNSHVLLLSPPGQNHKACRRAFTAQAHPLHPSHPHLKAQILFSLNIYTSYKSRNGKKQHCKKQKDTHINKAKYFNKFCLTHFCSS